MFSNIRRRKLYVIAIVSGILGIATLGLCNIVSAMEKTSQNTTNEITVSAVSVAAGSDQISVTGCPGNCGLCSSSQKQSETQVSSETDNALIY
jgi:hypothetical protein